MNEIDTIEGQTKILTYLKKLQSDTSNGYGKWILYGVSVKDIIKYIERPEACGNWPFDFVGEVYRAVKKIAKVVLVEFPIIEEQNEEDRVLSKLLKKNQYFSFGTNKFFGQMVSVNHVIQYMERDKNIYNWDAYFVIQVQSEVKRVKEFLL